MPPMDSQLSLAMTYATNLIRPLVPLIYPVRPGERAMALTHWSTQIQTRLLQPVPPLPPAWIGVWQLNALAIASLVMQLQIAGTIHSSLWKASVSIRRMAGTPRTVLM